jgi:hypothetical protein
MLYLSGLLVSRIFKSFPLFGPQIAVDIVSIGEVEENQSKLEDFVKAVDKDNNR